jgi:outer membrane protein assembly factor BamB
MNEISIIPKVGHYIACNKIVYYIDVNDSFCKEEQHLIDGVFSIRGIYENTLLLFDDKNISTIIYDTVTSDFLQLEYVLTIISQFENLLYVKIRHNNKRIYAIYNFKTHTIIEKYPYKNEINCVFEKVAFSCTEKIISSYFIENGKQYWQKEFSEKITGDILVYEDKLLVSLSEGDFICLEQSTGEEIWRCKGVYGYRKIIENNCSYEFAGDYFSIVDLKKGCKEKEINLKEINDKEKLFPISAEILKVGNRIYFISGGIPRYIPAVGSFNLETQTYDWLYRFDNLKNPYGFSGMNCLQYRDGLLYVLTNDGTLHIFEDELNK